MGHKQIRIGQLITPFGPGSLYTDRRGVPHVVCGLDHWFMKWNPTSTLSACDDIAEFEILEPRLTDLLDIPRLFRPPDFRATRKGRELPPNAGLRVPALRFPRWYRASKSGKMRRFNLNTQKLDKPEDGGRWLPVRFVAVCAAGHLCEFPWKEWLGCTCKGDGELYLTDRGGSELSSIRVNCESCPPNSEGQRGKSLAGTTKRPEPSKESAFKRAGIGCPGDRPWVGEGASEACNEQLVAALINQTNLYFPKTTSAIGLPDLQQEDHGVRALRNEFEKHPTDCAVARTFWNMSKRSRAVMLMKDVLGELEIEAEDEKIEAALESLFSSSGALPDDAVAPLEPEQELLGFRRTEFNVIRRKIDDPAGIPNLRVIPAEVPDGLKNWIAKVNLVERLRETRVFYGFDRMQQGPPNFDKLPDSAMRQLFRNPPDVEHERWLPAVEVFGEGIFIELSEERIRKWQGDNQRWLEGRLNDGFLTRLGAEAMALPPLGAANVSWASRFLLVHSLAHMLIRQLVFECGYSTASLRERLFVSADANAPMAGILIYTAAGDSEGTLGGLVRLGYPDRLESVVKEAISRASWCSADPVCSENLGGQGSRMANLAACHACILLPETSCDTINQGLDRAMVIGTPEQRSVGFMSSLFDTMEALD